MQRKVYLFYLVCAYGTMTFRISIQDGTKLYYQQVKYLQKWSWKVLYQSKLQDSVQLQTTLAMYEQEII